MLRPTYRHVFAVLAVAVSVYFAVRTSQAVLVNQRLSDQLHAERMVTTHMEQENSALQAQIATEQTPAYIEQVAREQLGLMRPGDHVVQLESAPPLRPAPPAATPAASLSQVAPAPTATAPAMANWQRWWALFAHPVTEPPAR
jgi:cell division protein FtsB